MTPASAPVARLRICADGSTDALSAARAVRDALDSAGIGTELLLTPGGTARAAADSVSTGDADVFVHAVDDPGVTGGFERVALLERTVAAASAVEVPAPATGAFGLFMRPGDARIPAVARLNHAPTARDVAFEQAVVQACAGTPFEAVGAHVFGGGVLAAVFHEGGRIRRTATALHASSEPDPTAQRLLTGATHPVAKRILMARTAEETSGAFRSWVEEAGWSLLHEPLIAFAPTGNSVPHVEADDRHGRWVWIHSPQAAENGLPADFPRADYNWACSSRAAAASLPAGCHPDWIGHSAPGEAMKEFADFIGPLGPADVLIPHSDSSVPRWEEVFRPYPSIRLHPWLAYAAKNRDEGALPGHDAAVLTGPAAMKAWKHRMGLNAGAGAPCAAPVLVAVHASTADAARDLGCAPHAVSVRADDEAVWEALVWALAVEAESDPGA